MKKILFLVIASLLLQSCFSLGPKNEYIIDVRLASDSKSSLQESDLAAIKERLLASTSFAEITTTGASTAQIKVKTGVTQSQIEPLLETPGNLAFYETKGIKSLSPVLVPLLETDKNKIDSTKSLRNILDLEENQQGASIAVSRVIDTAYINKKLKAPEVIEALKKEQLPIIFKWGGTHQDRSLLELYALVLDRDNKPAMHGDFISSASQHFSMNDMPSVGVEMTGDHAKNWEQLTRRAAQERFAIANLVDGEVYSAPFAMQAITGGRTAIDGNFTLESAQTLASILGSTSIPKLEITRFSKKGE